jgi:thymidylate synthase (FAD)
MNVKLVSLTKSTIDGAELSAEELLVYIARVSNPTNQLNTGTSDKLLAYLIKNKHWSPFDMVNMTVEVKTSKAIAIQILRHWSIKPQEFSQRYAEVTDIEPIHLRKAAASNRQSSEDRFDPMISEQYRDGKYVGQRASEVIQKYIDIGLLLYKELLGLGVAKECARMILPMATSTTMYLNGSARSWIHYLQQRLDLHAQKEHREVATEIKNIFQQHFPNIIKALEL